MSPGMSVSVVSSICEEHKALGAPRVTNKIEVIIGNRPKKTFQTNERIPQRRKVKRNNRIVEAQVLPVFSLYNMRSVWSKLSNLVEDIEAHLDKKHFDEFFSLFKMRKICDIFKKN